MKFSVGTSGHMSLRVFDLPGGEVAMLVNEAKEPDELRLRLMRPLFRRRVFLSIADKRMN